MSIVSESNQLTVLQLTYKYIPDVKGGSVYKDWKVKVEFISNRNYWHIKADAPWANNFTIHLADSGEHFFGVQERNYPSNQLSPDLRGESITVAVNGADYLYSENFASAWSAFYYNSLGYASFFDTFYEGEYKFGNRGTTQLFHTTSELDWYLFFGKDGNEIFNGYYSVIGTPKYIPLWACGSIVWRDEAKGGKVQILDDAKLFTDLQIPISGMLLDRPYSDGSQRWSKMNFNENFSSPEVWIKELKDVYGLELITWVAPMTFSDHDFPGLLPGFQGYMDLTDSVAIKEFETRLANEQYKYGVKGHKMDRADEFFPYVEHWSDKSSYRTHRNKYIFLYSKTIDSFLEEAWGKDQFNLSRSGFQRCQPHLSAIWGGDPRSSWDGMAGNLANAMRTSFMGFPNWGSDVGGYLGDTGVIPDELYIRWLQWGVWTGLFEIKYDGAGGNGSDRAPWNCSENVQSTFRKACIQRNQLVPYIYSNLNTASVNGTLMKPLSMMYPGDDHTYQLWNEYLFGNNFLVAPVTSSENKREVYFPEGVWINYYSPGEKIAGSQTKLVDCGLEHIPIYIKEGSVFVTGDIKLGNNNHWKKGNDFFVINAFPSNKKTNSYFDLVDMFDQDKIKHIVMDNNSNEINIISPPLSLDTKISILVQKQLYKVFLNGKRIRSERSQENFCEINIKKGIEINLTVKYE
ncbi:TIM-barrel domain-containing protein [Sunxiuqinia indica]|uniref:TIM-barrel domain-containing protein n=1 Tax=Sunxiuqinia indica TaxID=2692584 RepID=UPI0013578C69|nr:TIM-barrel domain-containing protein [Sunxiuqinia indica]